MEAKTIPKKSKPAAQLRLPIPLSAVSSNWHKLQMQMQGKSAPAAEPAKAKTDVWFDGVTREEIAVKPASLVPAAGASAELTKYVALDCEMVGVGSSGDLSMLARCSIVNIHGAVVYDTHVLPKERVTDFRTHVSGVRHHDVKSAPTFEEVQKRVADILKGRILVGHALKNDLQALLLTHPRKSMRDTAKFKPFLEQNKGRTPALRKLAEQYLGLSIQKGEHSSVDDARAAMALYRMHKAQWEKELRERRFPGVKRKQQEEKDDASSDGSGGEEREEEEDDHAARSEDVKLLPLKVPPKQQQRRRKYTKRK